MRELSLHISDILENSRVAGASLIEIKIVEDLKQDRLVITVADNGKGIEKEVLERVFDPFFTTRTCRKVGLGLPLFKAAARRCNGDVEITSTPGKGTTVHAVFQHSHIDRAPLGKLVSSLVIFIAGAPDIDLVYTHHVDEKGFTFDTRVLREELEGVPLNTPPVLNWISDYLRECLQEIGSCA
ncbi:MAG TPA: ATP-binding protein [Syntrophomonadaceae bacterium]|nr:ATP-binding protein [Syntrophomonadaceae bacterium]